MKNTLGLLTASVALLLWVSTSHAQESHVGKVVSVDSGKLVMTDKDGKNEHSHQVPNDATITLDGKTCKLDDLTKDVWVTVTTEKRGDTMVVTKVEGSKTKPKN